MIEKIKEAIQKDTLVIFVGAGMSIPLGFPDWAHLVINILNKIKEESALNFDFYIKQDKSIDIFKALIELDRHNYNSKVKKALYEEIKSINIDESILERHKKLWKISDKLITTNYDKVLEKVIPENIEVFTKGNEFQQSNSIQGHPFLYKIHGDISDPETCILFESEYKELYEKDTSDLQTLTNILLNKTILFIGFSLNDPFVTKQMEYLYKLYKGFNREHYILQSKEQDFSKYNVKSILIDNWDSSFDKFLDQLNVFKTKITESTITINNPIEKVDISQVHDIVLLENMLEEKKEEFEKENGITKKKVSREMHGIQNRLMELYAKKIQLNFREDIPKHKEGELEFVFESIYESEILTPQTLQQIQKIRDQNAGEFEWYQRSVLVSAIACSLINHKKVDPNKIDLLIDFSNDSEEKVWQKAITYLFLTLNHLGNKWLKYSALKPKLEKLKSNVEIQNALRIIIISLQTEAYNLSPVNEKIFNNPYFKENPFNYFLPFFKKNSSVEKLYDDDSIEDVEEFIDTLYDLPLPDSFKYLVCNSNINNQMEQVNSEERYAINQMLSVHARLEPFLNYVNEILNFYKNYPNLNKEFKEKTTILGFKNLKEHLLSTIEHHRAIARQFKLQNDGGKAMQHYEQLLNLDSENLEALHNLADLYLKAKRDVDEVLKLRLRIEEIDPKDHHNLNVISGILNDKKDHRKALKYINEAIELNNKIAGYYYNRSLCYSDLNRNEDALLNIDIAIKLDDTDSEFYLRRGIIKVGMKNFEDALNDLNRAIDLGYKNKGEIYGMIAICEGALGQYLESVDNFNKAIKLQDKESNINFIIGKANSLRRLGKTEEALNVTDTAFQIDPNYGDVFGSMAAIFSTQGKENKFYEYLEKALELKTDVNDFDNDIQEKYKNELRFQNLLKKYNQTLKK